MKCFNIDNLDKKIYHVGILTDEVIQLLGLNLNSTNIAFSEDKIRYAEKHADKFESYEQYKYYIESTPDIISNPDYVALHPSGKSIEYIKCVDEILLVAVRVRQHGHLWVKSFYPITQSKLDLYIKVGTAKPFKKESLITNKD